MSDKLTDAKKMGDLIEALGTNASYFSKSLAYKSHRTIYAILDGTNSISEGMMHRIVQHYPNVNYNFLKKGELPILLDSAQTQAQMNVLNIVPEGNDLISMKRLMGIPDQLDRIEDKLDKLLGDEG